MGNVKIYRSSDYDAPVLYGNAGYLIPVLDACLVNGFGNITITSMTHTGGTVTVTTALTHNLMTYGRQTISGANETGYNGEFIITVTASNMFTYQAAGIVVNTATGTLVTRSAGAGWTKEYSGTNLAAYRLGSGSRCYLRIDDTTTIASRCVGYEAMTDINTGTNPFPSAAQFAGGLYWNKSTTADATNIRQWIIIADDKTAYMWINYSSSTTFSDSPMIMFGDITSYKAGDAYNCCLSASILGATATNFRFGYITTTVTTGDSGTFLARSYSQIGTSVQGGKIVDYVKSANATCLGSAGMVYPHPVDGSMYVSPVWCNEIASVAAQSVVRGEFRGLWNPLHATPLAHGDTFQGSGTLAGKTLIALRIQLSGEVFIDLSLTW